MDICKMMAVQVTGLAIAVLTMMSALGDPPDTEHKFRPRRPQGSAVEDNESAKTESNDPSSSLWGYWKVMGIYMDGKRCPSHNFGIDTILITPSGKIAYTGPFREARLLTYRVDPTCDPKQMDVLGERGEKLVKRSIYSLEKKTLRICEASREHLRPTAFKTSPNDGRRLFVLELTKKLSAFQYKTQDDTKSPPD